MNSGGNKQGVMPDLVSELERVSKKIGGRQSKTFQCSRWVFQRSLVGKVSKRSRGEAQ
jgi:hypothetical protein